MEMIDQSNDDDYDAVVERAPLVARGRQLTTEGDALEVAILMQMRAAGLQDSSPSSTAALHVRSVATPLEMGSAGVLVASTQKPPFQSPQKTSQQSPKRRHDSECQSVVQTPMPNMSARRGDSFSPRETRPTNQHMRDRPTRANEFHQPQFTNNERLRPPMPAANQRSLHGFTTNMGSPSRSYFPEDNFDELMEDDDDMLDVANAFEQDHATSGSGMLPPAAPRAPLSLMSENVRRKGTAQPPTEKKPTPAPQNFQWSKDVVSALRKAVPPRRLSTKSARGYQCYPGR